MSRNIQMWSDAQKAVVSWTVTREEDPSVIETGNQRREIVVARSGDEVLRFSPSHTDDEIDRYARRVTLRQSHDLNTPIPGDE